MSLIEKFKRCPECKSTEFWILNERERCDECGSSNRMASLESRLDAAEKRLKWAEGMIDFARIIFTTLDGPGADVWLEHLKKGPV